MLHHKDKQPGPHPTKGFTPRSTTTKNFFFGVGGQVLIENTVAIVALFIFLLGVTQAFIWMNRNIIERQKAYQASRTNLGRSGSINFHANAKELRVFAEE